METIPAMADQPKPMIKPPLHKHHYPPKFLESTRRNTQNQIAPKEQDETGKLRALFETFRKMITYQKIADLHTYLTKLDQLKLTLEGHYQRDMYIFDVYEHYIRTYAAVIRKNHQTLDPPTWKLNTANVVMEALIKRCTTDEISLLMPIHRSSS
jgi:hypothetical protein